MDVMERMTEQEEIEKEASSFWESFVNEVVYHNRFNPNHPMLQRQLPLPLTRWIPSYIVLVVFSH